MCLTAEGLELTRVVALGSGGELLLDRLVAPRNPVLDHVTRFSGITPAMLEGVTTRLEDARAELARLLGPDTLLVAHSGENDLHALKASCFGGVGGVFSCLGGWEWAPRVEGGREGLRTGGEGIEEGAVCRDRRKGNRGGLDPGPGPAHRHAQEGSLHPTPAPGNPLL